jgi:DNA replication protein DnaC
MKDKTTGKTARETAVSACRAALRFIDRIGKEDNNLFIFGSTGVGKTFLTHCIAKEVLARSWSALYFTAGDLFELIADATFGRNGRNSSHLETIYACDFLTIDDLGTELTNNLVATGFYQVLNERILRQKSTIISTNLPMQEISARYSERIFSRMTSHYTIIRLIGDDIRIQKKLRGGNR